MSTRRQKKSLKIKDYRTDRKIIKTVNDAIIKLKSKNKTKINLEWIDNMSLYTFDSLVMGIFQLDGITKHTVDFPELKDATNYLIRKQLINLEKKEEMRNDEWFKYLNRIQELNFDIIQNTKSIDDDGLFDIYLLHKEHFLIGYLKGGFKRGVKEGMVFFNATEKADSKDSPYKNIYHKGTKILIGNTSIKENPEEELLKIFNNFNIEEKWINSNMKEFVPEYFFSNENQFKLSKDIVLKMSYYNLPTYNQGNPTFDLESSFKDRFSNIFKTIDKNEINKLYARSVILEIDKENEDFIKKNYFDYFKRNGIKDYEESYLYSALVVELSNVDYIENPFFNLRKTISMLDIDDCLELMNVVRKYKNKRYSKYNFNLDDLNFLKDKITTNKISIII